MVTPGGRGAGALLHQRNRRATFFGLSEKQSSSPEPKLGALTDPDVRISRIRLFVAWVGYAGVGCITLAHWPCDYVAADPSRSLGPPSVALRCPPP